MIYQNKLPGLYSGLKNMMIWRIYLLDMV